MFPTMSISTCRCGPAVPLCLTPCVKPDLPLPVPQCSRPALSTSTVWGGGTSPDLCCQARGPRVAREHLHHG